jgi:single-strand DNA-binding protein
MNNVNLTGRLARDPELRDLPGGEKLCNLRLAVDGMGRGSSDAAGFIDIAVFGASGEAAARVLTRGWLVAASGRLEFREWETDGQKRSAHAVVGRVHFLAAPRGADQPVGVTGSSDDGEDIPF